AVFADEDPLPPIAGCDARARLIRAQHLPPDDSLFDAFGSGRCLLSGAFEDRNDRALTQSDSVQITHCLDDPLIAQMLRLFIEDDGRFQARAEVTPGLQSPGQAAAIDGLTMRTSNLVLLSLNHYRLDLTQVGDLPPCALL